MDCLIHKHDNKFECSVYRKNTFTGLLGLSYFSNCSFIFKLNSVWTLLSRAYRVCSSCAALHSEFDFLKTFFQSNGYCTFIENQIDKFLSRKFDSVTTKNNTADVPNDQPRTVQQMCQMINQSSSQFHTLVHIQKQIKNEILLLLSKYYAKANFRIILTNKFTIGSFSIIKTSFLYTCACP